MTTQLYLQKAEMQLSRGLEEKALESLLSALACQNRDTVSETQTRCLWVNISSSISSMFRRRSSLAGFLTGLSSWNMTMMTYSMRRFVKLRYC